MVLKERVGLLGWVLDHRQPLLSNNPQEHASSCGPPDGHIPITRFLSVPVISGERVVAQIAVVNGEKEYTQDDTTALKRIANLFAIVMDRIKLERQLRHAGKLEAIGTLSAGIAHDFNNILGIILGFSEIAQLKVAPQDPVHHYLGEIVTAADRARFLVDQLLTFSRKGDSPRQPLFLHLLIKEVSKFLRASVPSCIEIDTRIEDKNLRVVGNANQLHQLLMNLCT
ncbi:MAG: GAF domain-containing protein, partial [Magnetococcales bacterium]|nr:GAF domain-containing protein [Magnetococcales bacterium]